MGEVAEPAPAGALVLLCGIPAAGKSTLASFLRSAAPRELLARLRPDISAVRVVHVCFDDVFAEMCADAEDFIPERWHAARKRISEAVQHHFNLGSALGSSTETVLSLSRFSVASREPESSGAVPFDVILLDDNMQYRSMRRAYHRLARDARLAFCTICLPIPLEEACGRNARRTGIARVTDATLIHMSEVMQWPDPMKNLWEKGTITISPSISQESFPWDELAILVSEAPPLSIKSIMTDEMRAEAASITAASAAHALDLRLRRSISLHLQSRATGELPASERASLARLLSNEKKKLLARAKSVETTDIDDDLVDFLADELDAVFTAMFSRSTQHPGTNSIDLGSF